MGLTLKIESGWEYFISGREKGSLIVSKMEVQRDKTFYPCWTLLHVGVLSTFQSTALIKVKADI